MAKRSEVTHVARLTEEFAKLSGQSLHFDKSFAFTTEPGGRKRVSLGAGVIGWKWRSRMLGAHLTFQGQPDAASLSALAEECKVMAKRVAALDLGFERRAFEFSCVANDST